MGIDSILGIAWENILVGLLGGIVVSLVFYLASFFKNKILERKYPIKGTYLTTFEDIENGETVNTSALAILRQHGKNVKGKTYLGNDRTWIIEGELTEMGNLHGVYFAADPMDKGIGNFFLKVANNRYMYGLWSGYDSENNIVNSGKYTFVPILKGYEITDAGKEHLTQIVAIANAELGDGFLNYQEMLNIVSDCESYICKVAYMRKQIIGFCLCRILPKTEICEYLHVRQSDLPRYINCAEKIGIIKTIAVLKKFQKRSVGHALTLAGYNELVKRDIQAVSSIAWKNGNRINANGVLTSVGLAPHNTIPSPDFDTLKNLIF